MANQEQIDYWRGEAGERWAQAGDLYDRLLAPYAERLLAGADPQPGERVLDVGCGNGATALMAAERVGDSGHVTGVDISTPQLEQARRRAAAAGVGNVTFVEADAQTHAFDGTYDVAMSRFGVMFFDDLGAAFANLATALRPGGRLAFVCWQEVPANEWITVAMGAIIPIVGMPELPPPGSPGPFRLADPDEVRDLLTGAGFEAVELQQAPAVLEAGETPEEAADFYTNDGIGKRMLEEASPEDAERAREALVDALAGHVRNGRVQLDGAAWLVTATKP